MSNQHINNQEIATAKKPRNDGRTPKLRFKEFDGDWDEATLGNLFTFKNGLNSDKEKYGSGIKFINVLDIIRESVITYNSIIGKVEVTDKELEKNEVIYGDILFQRSSETREEVGQANVYVDENESAVFGGFVIRGRKKVDYNPYFMNYLLKTSSARKEVTTKSGGSTRYNVGQDSLSKVLVSLTNLQEQRKIATFLTSVDDKIQQLTKKKTLLAQYKKGVMQQIFSQQLRFKPDVIANVIAKKTVIANASEAISNSKNTKNSLNAQTSFPDWEEKKLGEVCKLQGGFAFKSNLFKKQGIPIIRISNISNTDNFIDEKNIVYYDDFKINMDYILSKNDLIVAMSGATTGKSSIYNLGEKGFVNQRVGVFRPKKPLLNKYLTQFVFSNNFSKQLDKVLVAGAQPNISSSDIEGFKINIPPLEEQQKIATYLSAIDTKIANVQTQIVKTQTFKKGLLQQMFV